MKVFHIFYFILSLNLIKAEIFNKNVERVLDLSTQLVKETTKIKAEDIQGRRLIEYEYVIPNVKKFNLAYLYFKDSANKDLKATEIHNKTHVVFLVKFNSAVSTQTFEAIAVYTKLIHPFPVQIAQNDKQLVKYSGEIYFFSPYKTSTQTVLVITSSTNIISNSQVKPFVITGNKIKYGPFENIKEFDDTALIIHYENDTPFITIRALHRTIQVSHWGNIAVKEDIDLIHSGAKLKGSFSRYDFQKDSRSSTSAVKSLKTMLPASAADVYYRDSNGNISTSNMRILRDSVEVELRPRFPLFGGWKTQYTLGYNVPSFEYLFKFQDKYVLKMRIIDHIFDDMVIDYATVNIILPEGTSKFLLKTPFEIYRHPDKLFFTYLDTIGRPIISFSKKNLIENHIADFELTYTFKSISLLQEPLLIITFILLIFILVIIYIRFDFSFGAHQHKE